LRRSPIWTTAKEPRPVAETEELRKSSLATKREQFCRTTASSRPPVSKTVAVRAEEASRTVSRAETENPPRSHRAVSWRLKYSGIAHAVSLGVTLAVGLYPLGTVAGLGARLIQVRIGGGQDQADALRRLGRDLRALHAQADGELTRVQAGEST
jgi:hypothetical protein